MTTLPMALTPALPPAPFDCLGELPRGTTLLEASAGTGKTFTVAALATRYVAEGHAELGELLLVTFGRAATSELRERVRARLTSAYHRLRSTGARQSDDELVAHLADVDDAELARRQDRLATALADFDAATIATTHGFCQQMLTRLGVLADVDPDATMVGDVADLVSEVTDDVYLRRYASAAPPELSVGQARDAARAAMGDPFAVLEPRAAPQGSPAWHRVAFAAEVVGEVARRKRELRLLDYDDLLVLLRAALTDPRVGEQAAQRLRERYQVVMVDEFQDTDPVQWQILREAFHGHATLVLIGDPKQAIYAFRGGDVVTYLAAGRDADRQATLDRNWRSDAHLLTGLEQLLRGAALGDERIVVHPVRPGRAGTSRLEVSAGPAPPVRIRQVRRSAHGLTGTRNPKVAPARRLVCLDVAADVVRTLTDTWVDDDGAGRRPIRPGDIAVLTRRNADALAVRAELVAAGVPAVVSGLTSVFATAAARNWLTLLDALTDPGHSGRIAALALTPFIGWDAARLAEADEADRDSLAQTVRRWSQLLTHRGIGAVIEATAAAGLTERVTATGGERMLTDVRHIGQALQHVAATELLAAAGIGDWLRRRVAEAESDYAEEISRRLETDAAAVQVLTVHAAKGLEFPIVHVPFAWDRYEPDEPTELRFHDDAGRRILHIGGPGSEHYPAARRRHLTEERGEDLRLLYVALTRASSQVVVWWSPSTISGGGPLTRMLLGDHAAAEVPPAVVGVPGDDAVGAALAALAGAAGGTIAVETVDGAPEPGAWTPRAASGTDLQVAAWRRTLDQSWRRLSYSALTAQAHAAAPAPAGAVRHEPETTGLLDEPATGPVAGGPAPPSAGPSAGLCPLGDLPAGASFGTLVHDVLEHLDPAVAAPGEALTGALRDLAAPRAGGLLAAADLDVLAHGLDLALATPLGPAAEGLRLRDVAVRDRLSELEFELPLAGGDAADRTGHGGGAGRAGRAARLGDIADLLRRHLAPQDPLAAYADRLDELAAVADDGSGRSVLRGYLTGSIDAVLRVGTPAGPRYLVVDYKTNRLAPPGEPLTVWHYRPSALAEAMMDAHYPLQLLLYLVALHRFLRWRQPGYDPAVHLGGGLYLFLRGMCSAERPDGVMTWTPPPGLVAELSALLDRGPR